MWRQFETSAICLGLYVANRSVCFDCTLVNTMAKRHWLITSHSLLVYVFWIILGGAAGTCWAVLSVLAAGFALTGFYALVYKWTVVKGIVPFSVSLFSLRVCWADGVEIERLTCAVLPPAGTAVRLVFRPCFPTAIIRLIEEFNDHIFGSWALSLLSRKRNRFLICCQPQNGFD